MVLEKYKRGIVCKLKYDQKQVNQSEEKRGNISFFTKKSKNRLGWVYANGVWLSMITLTYHTDFPDFKESKQNLHSTLIKIRRMGLKYLWVVEWQGRGFPHYHIWMNRELDNVEIRSIVKTWLNVTQKYNNTSDSRKFHNHEKIYTVWNVDLNINYAVKYAEKQQQKFLPVGVRGFGRWWGCSTNTVVPVEVKEWNFENLTEYEYKQLKDFRRNTKRAIQHWSKRKKRNVFDKKVNTSFKYVLSSNRMEDIEKLKKNLIF